MATLRDIAAKAIAAGFTGKGIRNAAVEQIKPSPRRAKIGNADFDQLGKRQQKIVRRMAMQGDKTVLDLVRGWQLVSNDDDQRRRCNIRTKDAHAIIGLRSTSEDKAKFSAMLDAVRSHYL